MGGFTKDFTDEYTGRVDSWCENDKDHCEHPEFGNLWRDEGDYGWCDTYCKPSGGHWAPNEWGYEDCSWMNDSGDKYADCTNTYDDPHSPEGVGCDTWCAINNGRLEWQDNEWGGYHNCVWDNISSEEM